MELAGALNKAGLGIEASPVSPQQLGGLLARIADGTISGKIAKQVFEAIWNGEGDADAIIEAKGLKQITDTAAIESIIDEIIGGNPKQVEQFRAGKEKLLGFFVGQVMKVTQGKANPGQVNELLRKKLAP
jgi:aspartyl-tRNA(Asn)/glutamyl-tRNA(Gln) amidotransferase subunit B